MNEVVRMIRERLDALKLQEKTIQAETSQLQDRTAENTEHLVSIVKLRTQFEEALKKLEVK